MKRYDFIDYGKAIGILFVVFVHTGFAALNHILLFAMPLFFAATGYTFSYGKRSFGENVALRFRSILLPFFLLMLFYTLIEMLRAPLFGYGDASIAYPALANTLYGSGILPLEGGFLDSLKEIMSYKAQPQTGVDLILPSNCHLWFLPASFTAYGIFAALVKPLRKNKLWVAVAIPALLLLAFGEAQLPILRQLPFGLGRGAMGAAFMLFGFFLKDGALLENKSKGYVWATCLSSLVLFVGALCIGSDGSAFVRSVYGPYGLVSVLATFVGGCAGVWLVFSLCKAVEGLPLRQVKKALSYLGKNAMTVFAWHMAVKFFFDAFYLCLLKKSDFSLLDEYKMGLMPQSSAGFMAFEAVAVIAVCLLLGFLWSKVKRKIKKEKYHENKL